jgi:hypothetical protein
MTFNTKMKKIGRLVLFEFKAYYKKENHYHRGLLLSGGVHA